MCRRESRLQGGTFNYLQRHVRKIINDAFITILYTNTIAPQLFNRCTVGLVFLLSVLRLFRIRIWLTSKYIIAACLFIGRYESFYFAHLKNNKLQCCIYDKIQSFRSNSLVLFRLDMCRSMWAREEEHVDLNVRILPRCCQQRRVIPRFVRFCVHVRLVHLAKVTAISCRKRANKTVYILIFVLAPVLL